MTYDTAKFPEGISGLKAALKKINSKMKLGIYSDAGSMTCEIISQGLMVMKHNTLHCSIHGA